ncbi:DUF4112 domain-containing protein [Geotalea toluenoxydans]|uniref:DUF4112 domain-containing protein n=1 Tax=Geotalea toluenoxydans TaxID=421624 RepID=UPI0006CF5E62|nr:DUF4112 domain-containing protein [Geotalea toluenoxydans]
MNLIEKERLRKRLERLAWLTDSSIPVPGLNARVGIDPLIGLLPWFGDAIGALLSSYIVAVAARLGAPKSVLMKMGFNVAVDAIIGVVPGVGDLFDLGWKANQRNVRLLEHYIERPHQTVVTSRLFVAFLTLLLVGTVIGIGFLGFWLVRWLWLAVSGHGSW